MPNRTVTVTVASELDAPPDRIWATAQTPEAFHHVTRGLISFPALARRDEPFAVGETLSGALVLFGVVPLGRHHVTLAEIDQDGRRLRTHEHGGIVRTWNHDIEVDPMPDDPTRCRYTDRIEIDAGRATRPVAGFAPVL